MCNAIQQNFPRPRSRQTGLLSPFGSVAHAGAEYIPCATMNHTPKDLERFWRKTKTTTDNTCWIWQGAKDDWGYGLIWFLGRKQKSHRVSYLIHKGEIPKEMRVCHHCDTPACVNPLHLWLGTDAENAHDRDHKGRFYVMRGEENGAAKLNSKIVAQIKAEYVPRKVTMKSFALKYGVTRTAIGLIISGKNWRHIN